MEARRAAQTRPALITPLALAAFLVALAAAGAPGGALQRLKYNHPGLVVDLGVGLWAWPLPVDFDGDGDLDLVVSCPDAPYNGTYLFENPDGAKLPVFKPARKIGPGLSNIRISHVDGRPRLLVPGAELPGFLKGDLKTRRKLHEKSVFHGGGRVRANQWQLVDFDGDGDQDLVVGHGFWGDYGWDNAFDDAGRWTRGPLHGYIYLLRNRGADAEPQYEPAVQLQAGEAPVDTYGMPSPNLADFDGDGDLDLLCGSFLDHFTYFQNTGTRTKPRYAAGVKLQQDGRPLEMHLCMLVVSAVDWDQDGDVDLVVGQEDGRVALIEHIGRSAHGVPIFNAPTFFQQQADEVKFGALVTPVEFDWDGDGDEDLLCGNSAGEVGFIQNLGGDPPKWAAPQLMPVGGRPLRIMAGSNGSIQGPAEAKWGYTTFDVADWDHDGLPDLVVNSILGQMVWYRNIGSREQPRLAAARPLHVAWPGEPPAPAWNWRRPGEGELWTQWRTTPAVVDWDGDGLNDLVMLDHEGYLSFFRRRRDGGGLILQPGRRVFRGGAYDHRHRRRGGPEGPLQLNDGVAGRSGRRKLCVVDFDGDGRRDLLVNSLNVDFLRNITESTQGEPQDFVRLADQGPLAVEKLAGHTTSPTTVDLDNDGRRELLVGAEDGFLYHQATPPNSRRPVAAFEASGLKVSGVGFQTAVLKDGGRAFANRDYVWFDVPQRLADWRYTQTSGGEHAVVDVTAENDVTVYFATAAGQRGIDTQGWRPVDDLSFGYTDKGRTKMAVYQRTIRRGAGLSIPQGNRTGGLLLLPPEVQPESKPASNAPPQTGQPDADPRKPKPEDGQSRDGRRRRTNVLLIAVDDLRVELACYGDRHVLSPHIDRLAGRGTLFRRAYCQQAVCNPSRASLLTGLRPDTLGVWDLPTHFRDRLPDVVTLPQLFRRHGYHTQNIGKIFHNWRQDKYKGDAASWSVPAVMHYNRHGADIAQVKGQPPPNLSRVPRTEIRDVPDEAYFDGRIAARAVSTLRELKDRPFFLAVGFWKPHAHFNAPKKYWDLYDRADIQPPANAQPPRNVPALALHDCREILRSFKQRPGGRPTAADVLALRHGYYAATSYVDAQVGKVLDELRRLGLEENTVVVLWSDHGYHLGEHGLWAKTSNFELDARVPLIISTPGQTDARRTDALVELLDLYPTLAELCGLPAPPRLEGKSLRPVLDDPQEKVKSGALTQHPRPAYPAAGEDPRAMGYSLRTDRFRYTRWQDFQSGELLAEELYDHRDDPHETINAVADDAHQAVLPDLRRQLRELIENRRSRESDSKAR